MSVSQNSGFPGNTTPNSASIHPLLLIKCLVHNWIICNTPSPQPVPVEISKGLQVFLCSAVGWKLYSVECENCDRGSRRILFCSFLLFLFDNWLQRQEDGGALPSICWAGPTLKVSFFFCHREQKWLVHKIIWTYTLWSLLISWTLIYSWTFWKFFEVCSLGMQDFTHWNSSQIENF